MFSASGVKRRGHQARGVTPSPGLYFLGLSWTHSRGSALLGWVKQDAAYIAEQIRKHAEAGDLRRSAGDS